ncbi:Zn-dependent alcohol dehydrogenase [Bradyrhizobium canariense]|uniref:S-(Hydroxymethyl)glutathione dehydrogenase / alcohol dehydrogenase n=1 Tax=Bradyrhizobium canariense TaxID=255045 RepID=A0A1H1UK29_9BRAD|nr:Zn-dependent alcohol dehydrogenase [Bradyrhizobium canariense]SDS72576.1 S-(hydroxymethyl)glutathione dehydrogenase / alcohol dehydrogenase [Bradyrhizobium canariense]
MALSYKAAVLHAPKSPLVIETIEAGELGAGDALVRIKAVGLCHTDLEVIEGALRNPMPIILGHEASGVVEKVGTDVRGVAAGDHVVLSWNPHCGHCFYCDRDLPILCDDYLRQAPLALQFDGRSRAKLVDGRELKHLMYLGALAEYCIVPAQQAIVVQKEIPFDHACLIGCGVMTGVGAALNVASIHYGDHVMVVGCGAVGLSAVQGARMAGAGAIIAVDLEDSKLELARRLGATHAINVGKSDAVDLARKMTGGRGVDVILESAGSPRGFRMSMEAVRPGGQVIWLGKVDVENDVSFRWGSLMQEKRIRRSSYGGARPLRDFPMLAQAAVDGRLQLEELITARISLDQVNEGFEALRRGTAIRSVVVF